MKGKNSYDITIIITVALLVVIGIIMVFSSSYSYSLGTKGDPFFFLKRLLVWAVVGSIAMWVFARIKYWTLQRYANILLLGALTTLILVLTPLGININGASRWLGVGSLTVMPSEIAKFAVIIFVPTSIVRKKEKIQTFTYGLLPYLTLCGIIFGLIYLQPDFSTAFVVCVVIISMVFVGGIKLSHFIALIAMGASGLASMITYIFISGKGYKARRITAFLDPWADPSDSGFQAVQSLLAIGSGGLFGKGLGKSIQKHFYLPEPQNDFIFAIISEELGFIGGVFIILLFVILIWRGIRVAINAPDLLGCLMASGIISMITVQVMINIAVATSSMPVTGMPLPFISYGGTSLVITMACMGILLNISRHSKLDRS
ncbi:putative lipid II flippase FtsW [Serpentinicella alkaliphila]|uniref:Spore cortex peptidoglycan biosynthesis regulator SpoVE n=1 Tax=Serpentinicella alkaliphila TaxID=1734049 RepID=A0A4R2TVQ9_9FIRM|nr:putative lipid II flippase FtsW [Serpentinicella alkaliphila]QUH26771.1 putative lipid II flippase FtsW [Serpentinicella alkaliphila]TCQ07991.1 spore cortex peptidoglycan biosynthesis regulator SpoVE [Serpentinicella alkaliphila]